MQSRYDLRSPEATRNPFPVYEQILAEAPVHWNESFNGWVIARHEDVLQGLRDTRLSVNRIAPVFGQLPEQLQQRLATVLRISSRWTATLDPPEHTRLRGATQQAFTPRLIDSLRPRIQALTDELLDAVQDRGHMDLIRDFAFPLPATVIADLLGAPVADRWRFKGWSEAIVNLFGLRAFEDEILADVTRNLLDMEAYIQGLMEERRRKPGNDLISHLLELCQRGALSESDAVAECIFLLASGHETVTSQIGNSIVLLTRHPDQARLLREQPGLMPDAVEELLRHASTVKWLARVALEDFELHGSRISKGQTVILLLGAANKDPSRFAEPARLDLSRKPERHLGFGNGIHFCEGATLARLELEIALGTLLRRLPGLRLAVPEESLEYRPGLTIYSLKSLPVLF